MASPPTRPAGVTSAARPITGGQTAQARVGGGLTPGTPAPAKASPVATPAFKIESAHTRTRHLKILVYAEHGIGKTYFAGTAADVPELRDVFMLSAESGDLTVSGSKHSFTHIDMVRATSFKQCSQVVDFLRMHCAYRDKADENGDETAQQAFEKLKDLEARFRQIPVEDIDQPRRYNTLIVDSLTEIDQYCLNSILGVTEKTRIDEEIANAEWGDYRKNNETGRRYIRALRDLPMHCIFTAARGEVQDEAKRMWFAPSLTGKLAKQVQGFMDVVGFLTPNPPNDKKEFTPPTLHVQPTGRFNAKCRFPDFTGTQFNNPTIKGVLEAVGLIERRVEGAKGAVLPTSASPSNQAQSAAPAPAETPAP